MSRHNQPIVASPVRNVPAVEFTRFAMLLAANGGDLFQANEQAKSSSGTSSRVALILKSAVSAGTTIDPSWAGALIDYNKFSAQFVELVRPKSLLGRLQGFRRVPFATRTLKTAAAASAGWVGQAKPVAASAMDLENVNIAIAKVQALIVVTNEIVKFASAANESAVQDEMVRVVSFFTDQAFIDPALAAVPGTSPASITYGVPAVASSGAGFAAVTADLGAMARRLIDAGSQLTEAAWVLHPRTALSLSLLRDSAGALAFETITPIGGELLGLPVLTTSAVPISGSPGTTIIALVDASRILLADDDMAMIDTTRQTTIQMRDDPVAGAQPQVSLWQLGCTGIRCQRYVNWQSVDAGACAVLDGVTY